MSYLKLEHRVLSNERWLSLSPDAFVVHVWALDYCNEQATDGTLSEAMAARLACPVPPADLRAAWDELVTVGLWQRGADGLRCPEFLAYGIAADEQQATREKWAHDKRRRRLHDVGNHMLCTSRSCPAARECPPVESTGESRQDKWTTRPDPTRPDQTPKGSGSGSKAGAGAAAADTGPTSAAREAAARLGRDPHSHASGCCGLPPEHPIHNAAYEQVTQ